MLRTDHLRMLRTKPLRTLNKGSWNRRMVNAMPPTQSGRQKMLRFCSGRIIESSTQAGLKFQNLGYNLSDS